MDSKTILVGVGALIVGVWWGRNTAQVQQLPGMASQPVVPVAPAPLGQQIGQGVAQLVGTIWQAVDPSTAPAMPSDSVRAF